VKWMNNPKSKKHGHDKPNHCMERFVIQQQNEASWQRFSMPGNLGFLTEKQYRVLSLRSKGYTQQEIAIELHTSRANVSMLEGRAKKQVKLARQTLSVFELSQSQYVVTIEPGIRLQKVAMIVLLEADKFQIHLQSNMVEILRMVKKQKPNSWSSDGITVEKIIFNFNERGKLSLQ
jgi:HTH-type transcriptional regulator, fmd operon transcriptional regulator